VHEGRLLRGTEHYMAVPHRSHVAITFVIAVLLFASSPAEGQTIAQPRCGTGVHAAEALGVVFFPNDQLFCAVLADPKEPRSFLSFLRGEFRTLDDPEGERTTSIASVGVGDNFGIVRWGGPRAGEGVQLDLIGAIFAQFDMNAASNDLINADYVVGFPLTFRRAGFSGRIKIYHQSSHLGDEYLLRNEVIRDGRKNLSFEALELLASQELGPLRAYAGIEWLFNRQPETLAEQLVHGGAELRSGRVGTLQFVAGVDLKTSEQYDWSPAISGRAGLEVAREAGSGHPVRLIALVLEVYEGPSPYGQFFQDDIRYIGVGVQIGL
jgi:hypothetical protein